MDIKGLFILKDIDVSQKPLYISGETLPKGHINADHAKAKGTLFTSGGDELEMSLLLTEEQAIVLDGLVKSIGRMALEKYGR